MSEPIIKRVVPPKPVVATNGKGEAVATYRMVDMLLGVVMVHPFWREHARMAVELIELFDSKPDGPWDLDKEQWATLKQAMLLPMPNGQYQVFDDKKINLMFLKSKQALDEADVISDAA